jgi:hypothetical protein
LIPKPTWEDVVQAITRLNGETYFRITLSTQRNLMPAEKFNKLHVVGDDIFYAANMEFYNDKGEWTGEIISYITPELYWKSNSNQYRCFGTGYSNLEIQNCYLTDDKTVIERLAKYFLIEGMWNPDIPCIIENSEFPTDYGYGHEF